MKFRNILGAAALAAALAVTGAGTASAATAATSPTTTTFSYSGTTLTAAPGNVVPATGTLVTIDLTAQYMSSVPGETLAYVNASVYPAQAALENAGVPVSGFSNPVAGATQVAVSGTDDVATLYVVSASGSTFEVSGVPGGTPVALPPLDNSAAPVTVDDGVVTVNAVTLAQGEETISWGAPATAAGTGPYLTAGHVISVSNNRAEVGWTYGPGVSCALTETFGYGMTVNGAPHFGFTCFNASKAADQPDGDVGYWSGLAAGHTYDIELIPAGTGRLPLAGEQTGWITVVTTR